MRIVFVRKIERFSHKIIVDQVEFFSKNFSPHIKNHNCLIVVLSQILL